MINHAHNHVAPKSNALSSSSPNKCFKRLQKPVYINLNTEASAEHLQRQPSLVLNNHATPGESSAPVIKFAIGTELLSSQIRRDAPISPKQTSAVKKGPNSIIHQLAKEEKPQIGSNPSSARTRASPAPVIKSKAPLASILNQVEPKSTKNAQINRRISPSMSLTSLDLKAKRNTQNTPHQILPMRTHHQPNPATRQPNHNISVKQLPTQNRVNHQRGVTQIATSIDETGPSCKLAAPLHQTCLIDLLTESLRTISNAPRDLESRVCIEDSILQATPSGQGACSPTSAKSPGRFPDILLKTPIKSAKSKEKSVKSGSKVTLETLGKEVLKSKGILQSLAPNLKVPMTPTGKEVSNFRGKLNFLAKGDEKVEAGMRKSPSNAMDSNMKHTRLHITRYNYNEITEISYEDCEESQNRQVKKNEVTSTLPNEGGLDVLLIGQSSTRLKRSRRPYASKMSDYSRSEVIGHGAFANVHKGVHTPTGTKVAMKVYHLALSKTVHQPSIKDEIKILWKLNHPNIVKIYSYVQTRAFISLVLELVEGDTLGRFLKTMPGCRLNEEDARKIFKQIAEAIAYCHREGIEHRDIKLENIMINPSPLQIKIIDFGLGSINPEGKKTKAFCGTPSYMAPEILRKKEYSASKADVWAMGILLYVMLTGQFPFRGVCDRDLFERISKSDGLQYDNVPVFAQSLLKQIFVWDPEMRLTAQEVCDHPWMQQALDSDRSSTAALTHCLTTPNLDAPPCETNVIVEDELHSPQIELIPRFNVPTSRQELNDQVLKELVSMGYPRDYIKEKLRDGTSHVSTLYSRILSQKILHPPQTPAVIPQRPAANS